MMGHCYTGSDVDSTVRFFLNNTFLLRTFEKQADVKKVA